MLILPLNMLLSSCIRFSVRDNCARDAHVTDWITSTTRRVQVINTDSSLTAFDLENLYHDQRSQRTPTCLAAAQQHAERSFLMQWEAAKALEANDILGSLWRLVQSRLASGSMSRELDRIAELNDW